MKQLIEFTKGKDLHIEQVTPGEYISLKLSEEKIKTEGQI